MTREEAISLLTQVKKILINNNSWLENTHEPLNIAFDMAIKALEQEPKTEHCKNCKWRKDSNEAYRRGVRAEINVLDQYIDHREIEEVFDNNGYRYMFEPQPYEAESEDKK